MEKECIVFREISVLVAGTGSCSGDNRKRIKKKEDMKGQIHAKNLLEWVRQVNEIRISVDVDLKA